MSTLRSGRDEHIASNEAHENLAIKRGMICSVSNPHGEPALVLVLDVYTENELFNLATHETVIDPLPPEKYFAQVCAVYRPNDNDYRARDQFGAQRIILGPEETGTSEALKIDGELFCPVLLSQLEPMFSVSEDCLSLVNETPEVRYDESQKLRQLEILNQISPVWDMDL
jgi:hypothetical protein